MTKFSVVTHLEACATSQMNMVLNVNSTKLSLKMAIFLESGEFPELLQRELIKLSPQFYCNTDLRAT